mmetsp:Transcript_55203/g.131573  ORF Transcript_55203/g.131573 Transcript_55203/m.131573 type:complete len:95 (-) Transcript_55203:306-590(-)
MAHKADFTNIPGTKGHTPTCKTERTPRIANHEAPADRMSTCPARAKPKFQPSALQHALLKPHLLDDIVLLSAPEPRDMSLYRARITPAGRKPAM